MSTRSIRRRNFDGNFEDDDGGSYYVTTIEGEKVAGPFGTAAYAVRVRERVEDEYGDCHVERHL